MNEVIQTNTANLNQHRQNEMTAQEIAFLKKYDEGLRQIHAGKGIVKTLSELKAMEEDEG